MKFKQMIEYDYHIYNSAQKTSEKSDGDILVDMCLFDGDILVDMCLFVVSGLKRLMALRSNIQ